MLKLQCPSSVLAARGRPARACPAVFWGDEGALDLARHLETVHGLEPAAAVKMAANIEDQADDALGDPARTEAPMAVPCALCQKPGHGQQECPTKPPGATRCSYCKRMGGHTSGCPRGKGLSHRAAHRLAKRKNGPRAPKPATPTAASPNGLTAKGALAKVEEQLAELEPRVAELKAAKRVLEGLAG